MSESVNAGSISDVMLRSMDMFGPPSLLGFNASSPSHDMMILKKNGLPCVPPYLAGASDKPTLNY